MGGTGESGWAAGGTVLVLTGGRSARLGRDKATVHVGGRRLVDRLLAQVPAEVPVVLVGPPVRGLPERVVLAREDPPGGGPLAGLGAGLVEVSTPLVAVCAADMPFGVPVLVGALARLADGAPSSGGVPVDAEPADAVVPIDEDGRAQLLCAAYRTDVLRERLARLEPLAGRPMRHLLQLLRVMEWPVPAAAVADVDTTDELQAARRRAAEEGSAMQEWVDAVSAELGLDVACDIDVILDLARDAAHNVDRPAAPVTTYLLGAAVAGGADPAQAADLVSRLALHWAERAT
ncbi:MAG: DUF6457 domain-containing protein [Candidatus Nanopelagicales bacterium]